LHQVVLWLSSNAAALSILGAAVAFVASTTQQILQRRVEAEERQFQAYHEIVKKAVSPEPTDGLFYVDRQAAVLFELRPFPRYYDFTERLLGRLRKKWQADPAPHSEVLIEEIDLTLQHIKKNKQTTGARLWQFALTNLL
jgi:hypothetical protein